MANRQGKYDGTPERKATVQRNNMRKRIEHNVKAVLDGNWDDLKTPFKPQTVEPMNLENPDYAKLSKQQEQIMSKIKTANSPLNAQSASAKPDVITWLRKKHSAIVKSVEGSGTKNGATAPKKRKEPHSNTDARAKIAKNQRVGEVKAKPEKQEDVHFQHERQEQQEEKQLWNFDRSSTSQNALEKLPDLEKEHQRPSQLKSQSSTSQGTQEQLPDLEKEHQRPAQLKSVPELATETVKPLDRLQYKHITLAIEKAISDARDWSGPAKLVWERMNDDERKLWTSVNYDRFRPYFGHPELQTRLEVLQAEVKELSRAGNIVRASNETTFQKPTADLEDAANRLCTRLQVAHFYMVQVGSISTNGSLQQDIDHAIPSMTMNLPFPIKGKMLTFMILLDSSANLLFRLQSILKHQPAMIELLTKILFQVKVDKPVVPNSAGNTKEDQMPSPAIVTNHSNDTLPPPQQVNSKNHLIDHMKLKSESLKNLQPRISSQIEDDTDMKSLSHS